MMLRAGLWAFAGNGGHQLVNFALVIILARLLTPEAFGIVAAAQVILVLSQVVVKFGLGAALIQTAELTRRMERTALTLMLGIAATMSAIIYQATPELARLMNIPELIEIMPVMLITFLLSAATNPGMSLLRREMRFKLIAAIDVATFAFIHAVVAVSLALAGWSYWALILATLVSTAAQALIVWSVRPVWPTLAMQRKDMRQLLGFGSGMFLTMLGATAAQRVDNVVVASFFGPAALGFYNRAFSILGLTNSLLGSVFKVVLFSGFSQKRRAAGSDWQQMAHAFLSAHALAAFLILPISAATIVLAPELVAILLGAQWAATVPVLQVLAVGMYFRLAHNVSHAFNLAEGRVFATAWRTAVYAVLVGVFATTGAPFGIVGVGVGVLVALAVVFCLITHLSLTILALSPLSLLRGVLPFLAAGAAAGWVGWLVAECFRSGGHGLVSVLVGTSLPMATVYFFGLSIMRRSTGVDKMLKAGGKLFRGTREVPDPAE